MHLTRRLTSYGKVLVIHNSADGKSTPARAISDQKVLLRWGLRERESMGYYAERKEPRGGRANVLRALIRYTSIFDCSSCARIPGSKEKSLCRRTSLSFQPCTFLDGCSITLHVLNLLPFNGPWKVSDGNDKEANSLSCQHFVLQRFCSLFQRTCSNRRQYQLAHCTKRRKMLRARRNLQL